MNNEHANVAGHGGELGDDAGHHGGPHQRERGVDEAAYEQQ
jgi:hypothetical protein